MKSDETIVNLIFDAGKGTVAQSSREARCGEVYGALPRPTRSGYRFDGWYLGNTLITADSILDTDGDVRLQAHWTRVKEKRKVSSFKHQKWATITLAVVAVLLLITWAIVAQLISVYHLTDTYTVDGKEYSDRYTIKREDGVYKLFDDNGTLMPLRENSTNIYTAVKSGNQYRIDPDTGDYQLIAFVDPDTLEDYEAASGTALLLFPEISSSYVYSITVDNSNGSYTFVHTPSGTYIEEFKDDLFTYDSSLYAQLVVACGWPTASRKLTQASDVAKLPDGTIDYAVYGLVDPQATYRIRGILFEKDSNGTDRYSGGSPIIDYGTDQDGEKIYKADPDKDFTIHVGNLTPSKDGYYVRMEGKSSIYILSATYMQKTVMQPVEALVEPRAVHEVSVNTHSMAYNFMLKDMAQWPPKSSAEGELVVALTYQPLELRQYTMNTSYPYLNFGTNLLEGYRINTSSAQEVLGSLYAMEYVRCARLGVTTETLREFGMDKNVFYLQYGVDPDDSDGVNTFYINELLISQEKNENGNYYVASITYNMIVEVEPYYLPFVEWDTVDWYEKYFMQIGISYLQKMQFQFGDQTYTFTFDNDMSYAYYVTTIDGVKTLQAVDTSIGYLEASGTKVYYKTTSGESYEVVAIVDFDTVESLTYVEALKNPTKGNIVYVDEIYYYTNSSGTNVRVNPDYINTEIVRRDDGFYFVGTLNGQQVDIAVNRRIGEAIYRYESGLETTITVSSSNLKIFSDQYPKNNGQLDYTVNDTYQNDTTGETMYEAVSALDNFRRLHLALLYFSLEGDVNEKDVMNRYGMTAAEFIAANDPTASITIYAEDLAKFLNGYTYEDNGEEVRLHTENITRNITACFYQYTDQKAIVTLRLLDNNGNPTGEELGKFYIQASYLNTLQGYIEDLLNERVIPN